MAGREHARVQNELFFKGLNERIRALHRTWGEAALLDVVCECADAGCFATLAVETSEYDRIRASPRLFIVSPGHERPELERVVERVDEYHVVEKAEAARAL